MKPKTQTKEQELKAEIKRLEKKINKLEDEGTFDVYIYAGERKILQAELKGLQEGKVEQKKEEIEFLKWFKGYLQTMQCGKKCGIDYNLIDKRIKQLEADK